MPGTRRMSFPHGRCPRTAAASHSEVALRRLPAKAKRPQRARSMLYLRVIQRRAMQRPVNLGPYRHIPKLRTSSLVSMSEVEHVGTVVSKQCFLSPHCVR